MDVSNKLITNIQPKSKKFTAEGIEISSVMLRWNQQILQLLRQ